MNGFTAFKCTFCEHRVTTLDFSSTNGNRRTQAAAVIISTLLIAFADAKAIKLGGRGAL